MRTHEVDALRAVHAAFASDVLYERAGAPAFPRSAVRSDTPAEGFQGAGATLRQLSYEVLQSDFVGEAKPAKGDVIVDGADRWKVIDVTRRDDIGAWVLIVARA